MSARDQIRRYVRLLGDMWTPREMTDERVEQVYAAVRAEVLREAADAVAEMRDTTDVNVAEYPRYDFRQRVALGAAESKLRRMAAAESGSPAVHQFGQKHCSAPPCDAESGEPCGRHEREQAHAEGEHAFCGPECDAVP